MRMNPSRLTRLRRAITNWYWNVVNRFSRLAYLHHVLDGVGADELSNYGEEIEEIQALETEQWTRRGFRVHLSVNDIPVAEGQQPHWIEGATGSFVDWDTLRRFKKMVEDAEYERSRRKREGREMWVKWFTAAAAAIAGVAALMNLYLTYRNKR
jgi:hypothetical protein